MRNKALLQLLDRANYSHSERFRGFSHVLIFDFNEMPTRHLLDGDIRNAVTKFFDRKI